MPKGKKNLYHCQGCGENIVTLDIDEGVTPMFLSCHVTPGCKGQMISNMYRTSQTLPHQYEFYMPADFDGYGPEMIAHFQKGGLDFRRREIDLVTIQGQLSLDTIQWARSVEAVSAASIQRQMKVIYPIAAKLIDGLRFYGIIHLNKNRKGLYYVVKEVSWKE